MSKVSTSGHRDLITSIPYRRLGQMGAASVTAGLA